MTEFIKHETDGAISRTTEGKLSNPLQIELGSEKNWGSGKTYFNLDVIRNDRERSAGRFVAKNFPEKKLALQELDKCLSLKALGIPVPTTHRYARTENSHFIVYSDLSQQDRHLVWSGNNFYEQKQTLDLTQEEISAVEKQVDDICQKAAAGGYNLQADAYFLIKTENGEIEVVIADFGLGVYKLENNPHLDEINQGHAAEFMSWVRGIRTTSQK